MTNNSYYLNALDKYMKIPINRSWFHIYLDHACRKVAETCNLFDYHTVVDTIYNNDISLDAAKAAGIWFLQATELYKPNESLSTYIAALNDFNADCILIEFAVGWIWQNIGTEGFLRDMIVKNPMCSNVKKLWRWYEYLNIHYIKDIGLPLVYAMDKYSPLVDIFGDTQIIRINNDAMDYYYDYETIDGLLKVHEDESTEIKDKKMHFIENVHRAIFLNYSYHFAKWITDENSKAYPIPDILLLNGLYLIRDADPHPNRVFEIFNNFEYYDDDMLNSIDAYYKEKMMSFPDKTLLNEFSNWLTAIQPNWFEISLDK